MPTGKLVASDREQSDVFGVSVGIAAQMAVVAAMFHDNLEDNSGAAYIFSVARDCTDLAGFAGFQNCFTGDDDGVPPGCARHNVDADPDIDLDDFRGFMYSLGGP